MAGIYANYRQAETNTVAAAGMVRAGNVGDMLAGRLACECYLYVETGGPALLPISRVRPDYWVVTGKTYWQQRSYCCHGDTPVYAVRA